MGVFRIVLGFLVMGALHYYLWRRISPVVAQRRRWIVGAVLAVMFVLIPVTTTSRLYAPAFAKTAGWVTLTWMALAGLSVFWLAMVDLGRLIRFGALKIRKRPVQPMSPSRRRFLVGTAVGAAGASVGVGMLKARGEHEVVDVEVTIAKLPKALDGFTIVQLSDLHVGMTIGREFVQRVVAKANALKPDLIALTGDLIDGPVDDLADDVAPLGDLRAKHGVFAITGNHEYYSGADPWIAHISSLGARYLRNERVTITRDGASFDLAGVDDFSADSFAGHGEDMPKAFAGRDTSRALVLLAHQPRQVHHAVEHGVDLQLSGHTHGGQIWPWHYIVRLQQGGLLQGHYEVGDTQLYVSRGCGYWGPPVRLFAPLEITRVTLRAT